MADTASYLIELRARLLRCVFVITIVFCILCFFANNLFDFLALPLLKHLPQGKVFLATAVITPFITPLKLAFFVAIFITIPYILYQLWSFIAPALYQHERRFAWLLLLLSIVLFYVGVMFAYFVIFPWILDFSLRMAPTSVEVKPEISQFLDFALKLFLIFGLAFEVPIFTLLLIKTGITSAEKLKQKRPYIIVGAFVIGMLLTPPDVISQILLAVPLWLLFELGLVLSRFIKFNPMDVEQKNITINP